VSSLATLQQGNLATPTVGQERSFGGIIQQSNTDFLSLNTTSGSVTFPVTAVAGATPAPGCAQNAAGTLASCTYNFIPYDPNTVDTKDPNNWFNPLMFGESALGMQGNSPRNLLRLPGVINWDFSVAKDTKVGFLGENGGIQFRAEFFNVLNHVNFGAPTTAPFAGTATTGTVGNSPSTIANEYTSGNAGNGGTISGVSIINGGFIQAPNGATVTTPFGTGTKISTARTSRQIQLALKIIF
jgi:hypothetical protein